MIRTEYSWMETEELLTYVGAHPRASLETELAQRLFVAADHASELEQQVRQLEFELERYRGHDARSAR